MNDRINSIINRRSIRAYKSEQITDDELNIILECARSAPSAHNKQPWHFIVVQNKELLEEMSRDCYDENKKIGNPRYEKDYYSPFFDAPTIIYVLKKVESTIWGYFDCCLTTENIVVSASSIGVGSCIIADAMVLFEGDKREYYYKKLEIPEGFIPHIAVSIGYANQEPREKRMKGNNISLIK